MADPSTSALPAPGGAGAPAPPPRARRGAVARVLSAGGPALALIAVSLWEMIAVARYDAGEPTEADWRGLSAAVRAGRRADDLIVFAPSWIDPVGRRWLGDLIGVDMAARMDAARYARIWEVAEEGARAPETTGLDPAEERTFGELTLRRYQRRPADVVTDFVSAFAGARSVGVSVGAPQVGLEEVGFEPHRCVVLVPRPKRTVEITYPAVALGAELVGYAGLGDVFTRRDVREPGRLQVRVDGRVVADVTFGVDDGWVRFAAPTHPGPAEVVFAATAVGRGARDRRICFAAEARR